MWLNINLCTLGALAMVALTSASSIVINVTQTREAFISNDFSVIRPEDDVHIIFLKEGMRSLEFHNVHLYAIPHGTFSDAHLEEFKISNSAITAIEESDFKGGNQLIELNLNENHLTAIKDNTFRQLPKLTKLRLRENKIMEVQPLSFNGLQNLKELLLTGNKIVNLPIHVFDGLSELERLDLEGNKLHSFEPSFLKNQHNLQFLNIGFNKVNALEPIRNFSALKKLKYFWLYSNDISFIDVKGIKNTMPLLVDFFAGSNKWSCEQASEMENELNNSVINVHVRPTGCDRQTGRSL